MATIFLSTQFYTFADVVNVYEADVINLVDLSTTSLRDSMFSGEPEDTSRFQRVQVWTDNPTGSSLGSGKA